MKMKKNSFNVLVLMLVLCLCGSIASATSYDRVIKVTVNQCDKCPSMSHKLINITKELDTVSLSVPRLSSFFVVQVHNYLDPLSLSYTNPAVREYSVNGTNIGLNQVNNNTDYVFYLFGDFTRNQTVLFAITSYSETDPIPGGCNMEFNTESAPYQILSYNENLITVNVQSPSVDDLICELQENITIEFYQMYLDDADPFADPTYDSYYSAILKMLRVQDIRLYGSKVIEPTKGPKLRRFFSNYVGFGSVYAVIATYEGSSSAYVPNFSYGCDMHNGTIGCHQKVHSEWVVMVLNNLAGLFLLFTPTSIIAPVVPLCSIFYYGGNAILAVTGIDPLWISAYIRFSLAALLACIITCVSVKIGIKKLLMSCYTGHILTACIYFGVAAAGSILSQSQSFFAILYPCAVLSSMMVCLHDGAARAIPICFHAILAADYFLGNGILTYINIDTVRFLSVGNFNIASVNPPNPAIWPMVCLMMATLIAGVYKCCKYRRGAAGELEPLLSA